MENKYAKQTLRDLPDEQLVAVFRARGASAADAFGVLIHRHQADLLRRCWARLGNGADAEEAVQETLLRVFRGLLRFRGDAAFRTWLFSIADNQCSTLYQRRSRHVMSEHVRALISLHEETCHVGPARVDAASAERVRDVLSDLPRRSRDVLMLRFYGDLSLEDIARTLGIGLSAAKMRLYRALTQFEAGFEILFVAEASDDFFRESGRATTGAEA